LARNLRILAEPLRAALGGLIIGIEHVGSTSFPGLAAKPIIDLDVVISSRLLFRSVREQLAWLGYQYRGNLGIPGREAFQEPTGRVRHHLYVCSVDTPNLHNHLQLRDYLRMHPEVAAAYAVLKRELARQPPYDIEAYVEGKTAFIKRQLAHACEESSRQ
jgi:GrpB-like predicted nucleotidyltransferase (UPF0157 family)